MSKAKRRRRPTVARTEPDRSLNVRRMRKSTRANGSPAPSPQADQQADVNPREAGYQAINDAYRLIDEYLRQGQRMAENLWMPLSGLGDDTSRFKTPERF